MASWVKCLLYKHEDVSLDPQHPHKKTGVVVCASIPSAGRGGDKQILETHQPVSLAKLAISSLVSYIKNNLQPCVVA